ncbi:MAG: hypothetical protein C4K60_06545 [Ideonella sp. MAG2]|nr:MAG: hypothetical protein C4K60_06545 [Ideonella sp. MAG2]
MKTILESIDKDIETHNQKASQFLNTVHAMLFVAILFAALYILPGLADRALPGFERDFIKDQERHVLAVKKFKDQFKKDFYFVSEKEYESAKEKNQVTPELTEAWTTSRGRPNDSIIKALRFTKALSIDDSKMESLAKLVPIILGAVLAGFLLTYRFHVQTAKEFTLKKIELMAKIGSESEKSSA